MPLGRAAGIWVTYFTSKIGRKSSPGCKLSALTVIVKEIRCQCKISDYGKKTRLPFNSTSSCRTLDPPERMRASMPGRVVSMAPACPVALNNQAASRSSESVARDPSGGGDHQASARGEHSADFPQSLELEDVFRGKSGYDRVKAVFRKGLLGEATARLAGYLCRQAAACVCGHLAAFIYSISCQAAFF